jgi:hypothetical protein
MAYTTINKHTDYFNTLTYSGNGSNPRTLTGVGFQPDLVWLKNRTDGNGHTWADAVRGANKTISSDGTDAEITDKSDGHLDAFTSDGFTVGAGSSSDARVNDGSHTYVAWNWKANGAGSANTDGSINSTVSVNTTAGFSVVKFTTSASGSSDTIGHGLGAVPSLIISRPIDGTSSWFVYHKDLGNGQLMRFNNTDAKASSSLWNNTTPTSSVFSLSLSAFGNGDESIAYCFAEKTGYSKFGSFIGNANADGSFVYTGFKPSFLIVKATHSSTSESWLLLDSTRQPFNLNSKRIRPDNSGAEDTNAANGVDLLSNGFKIRTNDNRLNGNGQTLIYMAFGQSLVGSNNVPCTAR